MEYASGIRLRDCPKLAINWKNDSDVTICRHGVIVKFFWRCFVSLVKFRYWSKFHVIITGFGVITILFHEGLSRNPEIGNKLVWALSNIWRLGQVRDTKFGPDISNKMLLKAAKFQGYSFYHFWLIKRKPTGGEGKITPPPLPPRLRLSPPKGRTKDFCNSKDFYFIPEQV